MTLIQGDCVEVIRSMPGGSVDAVVTDPPYDLTNRVLDEVRCSGCGWVPGGSFGRGKNGEPCERCGAPLSRSRKVRGGFMGKDWDSTGVAFDPNTWAEALRVLKPGGHLLAFGGTRTVHRLTCAIEDAGFEVRDSITWLYGSGFPKSKSMKDIDRPELGTALKPAHEIIVCARKPLSESSVARNVLEHGTGALNIDESRIHSGSDSELNDAREELDLPRGRWPANVILSHSPECQRVGVKRVRGNGIKPGTGTGKRAIGFGDSPEKLSGVQRYGDPDGFETTEAWECVDGCPVAELDRQSGNVKGATSNGKKRGSGYHENFGEQHQVAGYKDQGGASRFFKTFKGEPGFRYQAKASRKDRGEGNTHPTCKPTALMRYLVKLVTPPGGVVLDPFAGSGSTLVAAIQEGFEAVGIEQDASYIEIAERRIAHARAEIESQPLALEV